MAKISRPAVYTFVGAVAIYAGVLLTQPDPPTPTRKVHVLRRTHSDADVNAIDPGDLNAHFDRYLGGKRNPFLSGLPSAGSATAGASAGAGQDRWMLTGINVLNGAASALVENETTGESVFLRTGDRWRGLRVVAIGAGSVSLLNALGQKTRLAFKDLDTPVPAPGVASGAAGASIYRLPPLGTAVAPMPVGPANIQPLPPMGAPAGMPPGVRR